MTKKNKKIFQTEKLNELQRQQKRAFLIFPTIMAVLFLWGGSASIAQLDKNRFVTGMLCIVIILVCCSAMLGIVPFYMRYISLQGKKKQIIENSSFITVDNLEYYRDKLEGITPGAISMLENLQIEQDKDLTACILYYEMLGLIRQTEQGYEIINRADLKNVCLQESDRYLLNHLEKGDWNLEPVVHEWKLYTIQEVKQAGWIAERLRSKKDLEKTNKKEGKLTLLWLVVLTVFCFSIGMGVLKEELQKTIPQEQFDKIPQVVFVLGEIQQEVLNGLDNNQAIDMRNPGFLWKMTLVVILDCMFLLILLFPVFYLKFGQGRLQEQSPYRRTTQGEIYTEYIYGMKNFIHDYSNLSEVQKDGLALWDDYLIYAVVLEENEKIVDDIKKRRLKI